MTPARFTTKELSKRTWGDYVRFFSQGNGWDHCGCTAYQGFRAPKNVRKWADKRDWNLEVKCDLVEQGRAHGILVYAEGEPVGWCQFGPQNELPITTPGRRQRPFEAGEERLWRITCFCTRPDVSQQGVAGVALRAALRAIAKRGGGLVEAYPMAHVHDDPRTDERQVRIRQWESEYRRLMRKHGTLSTVEARKLTEQDEELRRHLSRGDLRARSGLDRAGGGRQLSVEGVGTVNATYSGRFHGGTVAMFEREGFRAVVVMPVSGRVRIPGPHPSRLVMQKTVQATRR